MHQKTMHRRSSILKFFRQLLAQKEIVVIRSARPSELFCHTGQDQLVPDQMDWVQDFRDDHLDAPVKHMTLKIGIAEIVDPILLAPLLSRVKSTTDLLFKRTVAHQDIDRRCTGP